ncbi:hypothetical protein EV127DRAFT_490198 [Xylaria flabelliformis]|nr:hypothetical protein EV127DRAFT_490198 [Xylaria flabelliformis]
MTLTHNNRQQLPRSHSIAPHNALPTANSSARKRGSKSTSDSNFILSSSRSHSHPPQTIPEYCPNVADTNPTHTAELWDTVMSYRSNTLNSRGENDEPAATSLTDTTMKELDAKVTDVDFLESVLEPYGITVLTMSPCLDLIKHFGITDFSKDDTGRVQRYKTEFPGLGVWLELDNIGFIQKAYRTMTMHRFNEAEHAHFALCHIFRAEPLVSVLGDQCSMPYRTIQLFRKIGENKWLSPPNTGNRIPKRYDWDIRPHCTYHYSLSAFQDRFRGQVESFTSVIRDQGICPYFTVEFKKENMSAETACYRVAASSALSLYNRYLLKCKMRAATLQNHAEWSGEDKRHIRHYGLTFAGPKWTLYCILPKTFPEWTGCTMRPLYKGNCLQPGQIRLLIELVNDIHYWGLAIHGESCKQDIYRCQGSLDYGDMGDNTSLVDMSLEDTSSAE